MTDRPALSDSIEIITPEAAVERLGQALFDEMERMDPTGDGLAGWNALSAVDKHFYTACVDAILANSQLVRAALRGR